MLAVLGGHGTAREILHERIGALGERGLKLDHGLNDTISFSAAFRRKRLGLFQRRENGHGRPDIGRGARCLLRRN